MNVHFRSTFLAISICLAFHPAKALVIFDDVASFSAQAQIESTTDFNSFSVHTVLAPHVIFDGVLYATAGSNWIGDPGHALAVTPTLISANIDDNSLSFGPGRHVLDFAFELFKGNSRLMDIEITELDGSRTQFSLTGPFLGETPRFLGFSSDTGIIEVTAKDNPLDSTGGNWSFDNVMRSGILGTDGPLPPLTILPPYPIPEPTTLALFGIGLLGLGVLRRRLT